MPLVYFDPMTDLNHPVWQAGRDEIEPPPCCKAVGWSIFEAESSVFVVACRVCERFFRVELHASDASGRGLVVNEVTLRRMQCPRCDTVGHAVQCDLPDEQLETYTLVTCSSCQLTFDGGRLEAAS